MSLKIMLLKLLPHLSIKNEAISWDIYHLADNTFFGDEAQEQITTFVASNRLFGLSSIPLDLLFSVK